MDDIEYRRMPRIANSDLGELEARRFGQRRRPVKPETLDFGTHFHGLVLEPHKRDDILMRSDLTNIAVMSLLAMEKAVQDCNELHMIIQSAQREVTRVWDCLETGLPLKGRLDIVAEPRRVHLIDLKTTSCTSKQAFIDTIAGYNYDRQAAFYLDSDPKARFFEFAGVQKVAPYALFRVQLHRTDELIVKGRQEMLRLLWDAKLEFDRPDGWRPSSWTRKTA